MTSDEFCVALIPLRLSSLNQALAIIWFGEQHDGPASLLAGTIARRIRESGLGNPNSTQLAAQLRKSRYTLESSKGFRLKPTGTAYIAERVAPVLQVSPKIDQSAGFLPKHIWTETRSYIHSISEQINGCYQFGFYDAASVLVRRLVETLLIEAYEHIGSDSRIRGQDGDYVMLSGIINDAVERQGLSLGRETKRSLRSLKELGDRAAHNRRYTAGRADMDKLQAGLRVVVDELVQLAELRRDTA